METVRIYYVISIICSYIYHSLTALCKSLHNLYFRLRDSVTPLDSHALIICFIMFTLLSLGNLRNPL